MGAPGWLPKSETERMLANALARGDQVAFFRAFAAAELYLPQVLQEDAVVGEGSEQWVPVLQQLQGEIAVPVFTSLAGMGSAMRVLRYAVTSFPELRDRWVKPGWWLAINPGLPIEAYLPVAAVERVIRGEVALVGDQLVPADPADDLDSSPEPDPGGGPDEEPDPDLVLHDPDPDRDPDDYVAALLDATVLVPTTREVVVPDDLLAPGTPWWRAAAAETPTIEVFTTEAGLAAAYPSRPRARLPFLLLMLAWPDGHALSVDPAGPVGMTWPADQVRSLQQRALAVEEGR